MNQGGAGGAPEQTATGQGPSVVELQAQLEKMQSRIADLSKEAAGHRVKAKTAEEEARKVKEAQGQFQPLYEETSRKLAALEPAAARASQLEEFLLKRLESKTKDLPQSAQVALEAIPSVEARYLFLEAFESERAQHQAAAQSTPRAAAKPPIPGGPPPTSSVEDDHRKKVEDLISQAFSRTKPVTSLDRIFGAKK